MDTTEGSQERQPLPAKQPTTRRITTSPETRKLIHQTHQQEHQRILAGTLTRTRKGIPTGSDRHQVHQQKSRRRHMLNRSLTPYFCFMATMTAHVTSTQTPTRYAGGTASVSIAAKSANTPRSDTVSLTAAASGRDVFNAGLAVSSAVSSASWYRDLHVHLLDVLFQTR